LKAANKTTVEERIALGPYQGLTFFTEDDAEFFFGRDRWCDVIIANLRARRLTVLYGPSGVGKSSLLRAGVITRLEEMASQPEATPFIPIYFSSWQTDPIGALTEAIRTRTKELTGVQIPEKPGILETIADATERIGVPLLAVLDQFEDYWTYAGPSARDAIGASNGDRDEASFASQLARVINTDVSANFLIALREDSLAQLDRTFRLGVSGLLDHRLSLTPLTRAEGALAIREPLAPFSQLTGAEPPLEVEDDLVDAVLEQVRMGRVSASKASAAATSSNGSDDGDAIEAPYLQLVMRKIWEHERGRSSVLRAATLRDLGGAKEIVSTHVENALRDRSEDEQDAIADLLRYLVSPSHTKIAYTVKDLARFTGHPAEKVGALLTILADPGRRIIRAVGESGETRFEIFHDVLGEPLLEWAGERERARAEREKAERVKAVNGRRRARAAALALLVAVLGALVAIIVISINNADEQRNMAQSEQLAARATQLSDAGLASLYALESYGIAHTEDARSAILQVGASHEIGTPLATADGGVDAIAWSPNRTTLVTGGSDGWLRLFDARTHREMAAIPPPGLGDALKHVPHLGIVGSNIGAVAFSPDGKEIAYGRNIEFFGPPPAGQRTVLSTVHLWNLRTNAQVPLSKGRASRINALAFSHDGSRLAGGYGMLGLSFNDYTVRLWNLRGRVHEQDMRRHTGPVNSVAFSRDDKTIASSSCDEGDHDNHTDTLDHTILLWTPGKKHIAKLTATTSICGVAFSPDGKLLAAAGDDRAVTLWDVARRRPDEPPFVGHTDVLNSVAFSRDGKVLASAGRDHTVRLWDVASHRQIGSPLPSVGGVATVAFDRSGATLASASIEGARIFNVVGPYELGVVPTISHEPAYDVAFSPEGNLVAWFDEHTWPRNQEVAGAKVPGTKPIGGTVYIWDPKAGHLLDVIRAPTDNINSLAFGPGGRTLVWAASEDQSVWVWNVWRHSLRQRIPTPDATGASLVERVAVSPVGNTIAFAEMVGERATIHLWDVARHRLRSLELGKVGSINALAFSPDGKLLASAGSDGNVRLWDLSQGRQTIILKGHTFSGAVPSVYSVAFSPDGKTLVSGGGDGSIMFWDAASHHEIGAPLTQHTAAVYGLTFSHDGRTLASASLDGTARLWDVSSKRALLTLTGHTSYVYGAAFRKDGNMIATAGDDGTVRFWGNFSLQAAIARLCTYIDTRTAPALWHRIEPSIGYRAPCQ
jgi:WD40 repeat protein